jgi:hypothetical protein
MRRIERITVNLIGAPCAGKTSICGELDPQELRSLTEVGGGGYEFKFIGEAWDYYEPFAQYFFTFPQLSVAQRYRRVKELRTFFQSEPITSSIQERLTKNYGLKSKTLWELYTFLHLGFLGEVCQSPDLDNTSIRTLFQRDLLRIQLFLDQWTQWREHRVLRTLNENQIFVSEGGAISILCYLAWLNYENFRDIFRENLIPIRSKYDAVLFPNVIVFLETLCRLPLSEYQQFFFDDRRLDTPEDAQELDKTLYKIMGASCNRRPIFILRATQSLEEKIKSVKKILTEDMLEHHLLDPWVKFAE